jgi:hypothetical protein
MSAREVQLPAVIAAVPNVTEVRPAGHANKADFIVGTAMAVLLAAGTTALSGTRGTQPPGRG